MSTPKGYTIEYDMKNEPRKLRCGSRPLLEDRYSNYGVPYQFLTDHGTQFYSVKGGFPTFDKFCLENTVDHILSSIAHPQTLGKTEQRHNMMKNYLDKEIEDQEFAPQELFREAVDR